MGSLHPIAQAQIQAAEARRREGVNGLRPIANPGSLQRPTGPQGAHPETGEKMAAPVVGCWLVAKVGAGSYNNDSIPELRDRFGGYMVCPIEGDEGIIGYRTVRMTPPAFGPRKVEYHNLAWDQIDWTDLQASGAFVDRGHLKTMIQALFAEMAGLGPQKDVDHSEAISVFSRVLKGAAE